MPVYESKCLDCGKETTVYLRLTVRLQGVLPKGKN
jgi:predicted nucleic acid-binding Zn ribbon protein